jgi:hypothetical protein
VHRVIFFFTYLVPIIQTDLRIDYSFAYAPFYFGATRLRRFPRSPSPHDRTRTVTHGLQRAHGRPYRCW